MTDLNQVVSRVTFSKHNYLINVKLMTYSEFHETLSKVRIATRGPQLTDPQPHLHLQEDQASSPGYSQNYQFCWLSAETYICMYIIYLFKLYSKFCYPRKLYIYSLMPNMWKSKLFSSNSHFSIQMYIPTVNTQQTSLKKLVRFYGKDVCN